MSLLNCHYFKGDMNNDEPSPPHSHFGSVRDLAKNSQSPNIKKFAAFFKKKKHRDTLVDTNEDAYINTGNENNKNSNKIIQIVSVHSNMSMAAVVEEKMKKTKSTGNILASFRKKMNTVKRSRSSSNRNLKERFSDNGGICTDSGYKQILQGTMASQGYVKSRNHSDVNYKQVSFSSTFPF